MMGDITKLRKKIDKIDSQLLPLFKERLTVVQKIGAYKKTHKLSIKDPKRELILIEQLTMQGKALGLSPLFIKKIWKTLFQEAYKIQ
ncbi:MAG: hypothetical protein A3B53_02860 [Candidatus Levybacteria bacterium RIFCSPLOWO2_01_FULL_42_15]|nr:MAG: hypothetical protein A3B53_02860 [Candidatus Levybacteria bacterium RIFCSPLOWO2_01_FULL_42_15]